MVTIVKHEWHSVDSQFAFELERELLEEIYPTATEEEMDDLWERVQAGDADLDQILEDAYENDVDIDWDRQYDDWYSDRKGGYDVTYEYGDEDSWHHEPPPLPDTHKCTKCKWTGNRWNTSTAFLREYGTVIDDYYNQEEEAHEVKDVCPMCDSDTELTEYGIKDKQERDERIARWAEEVEEEDETAQMDIQQALNELKKEFDELMAKGEEENKKNE